VCCINGGNREQIRLDLIAHRVEVGEDWSVELETLLHFGDSFPIHIAQSDELDGVAVVGEHIRAPHGAPSPACADDRVAATRRLCGSGRAHRATYRRHPIATAAAAVVVRKSRRVTSPAPPAVVSFIAAPLTSMCQ
jgi:hypothetical protein